jgi:hypothetical protein
MHANGQPANLFFDPTDGTIVPDGDGTHAKLFVTDKNWKRVIYCDRDFVPQSNQSRFKTYDNTNGAAFQYPTSITFGKKIQTDIYQLYISDYESKKIKVANYNSTNYTIYNNPANINTLSKPFDIGFHYGSSQPSDTDDKLFYSTDSPVPAIKSIFMNGSEIITVNKFYWQGSLYQVQPSRIDVFTGMNSYGYYKERSMLAYVDKALNAVIYFRLTENGEFFSNPPTAFWVQQYPSTHALTSVKFIGNLPYASDPASVAVTANQISNTEGTIFMSKVKFRPENNGTYVVPFMVDYLASTNTLSKGEANGSTVTPLYKDIRNIESNVGFVDMFTSETWNNETGLRRIKPGVEVTEQSLSTYCLDWKNGTMSLKTTSPAWIEFQCAVRNGAGYTPVPLVKVNGSSLQITNGKFRALIPSGFNYFNFQVGYNSVPLVPKIFVSALLVPQDEMGALTDNTKYKVNIPLEAPFVAQCSSPGGCPFISVLDSGENKLDNNLLHRSEFSWNVGNDITDKYLMNIQPKFDPADSTCTLTVRELDNDYSYFDRFELIAVDHPQGTKIGITENNDIVTYMPEYVSSPLSAWLDEEDVTDDLGYDSSGSAEGDGDDNYNGEYGDGDNRGNKRYNNERIRADFRFLFPIALDNIVEDSQAVILDPDRSIINPSPAVKDYLGTLYAFDTQSDYASPPTIISRRENRAVTIAPVGKNINIDSVHIDFNADFSVTYIATTTVFYGGYIENELPMVFAEHSKFGNIDNRLASIDEVYCEMDNQDSITLKFKDNLQPLAEGWIRDYIIVTRGRYNANENDNIARLTPENNIPKKYALYQNYPNPFNPTTTISYDLPKYGLVKIKIFDITGREMAILVNEFKSAGSYKLVFNGTSFASGVYFYKIEAGNFIETKRMVLIK